MSNQKLNEVIKAMAYGETPEQVAEAEGVGVSEAEQIQQDHAEEIAEERKMLRKAGYLK